MYDDLIVSTYANREEIFKYFNIIYSTLISTIHEFFYNGSEYIKNNILFPHNYILVKTKPNSL